jgi:hypothetical protein
VWESINMTLTNFSNAQVLGSFCSVTPNQPPYWLFRIFRGDVVREYRLPKLTCDWPAEARWNHLEDREPLLSVAVTQGLARA